MGMITLNSLEVTDYVLFEKATLPLNRVGITVIKGKNLDSNSRLVQSTDDDTNAVGKTSLLSAIPELVLACNPLTQAVKAKAKKDVFANPNTSIALSLTHNDTKHTFEKHSKGKSVEYVLKKDGEDRKARTIAYPESKIRSFFDLTEDEFYTLYFVSSSRPSTLQYGTASSRLQFFTNLFRLNNYDEVRKLFNALMRDSKDSVAALKEIEVELEELAKANTQDIDKLSETLQATKLKAKEVSAAYNKLQQTELKLSFIASHEDTFKTWNKGLRTLGLNASSAKEVSKLLKTFRQVVEDAKAYEKARIKLKVFKQALSDYGERKAKLITKLEEAKPKGEEPEDFEGTLAKLKSRESKYAHELDTSAKAIKQLKAKLQELEVDTKLLQRLDAKLEGLTKDFVQAKHRKTESRISSIEDTLTQLKAVLKESHCPTCQQAIDKNLAKKLYREFEANLEALQETWGDAKRTLKHFETLENLKAQAKESTKLEKELATEKATETELKQKLKAVQQEIEALAKWEDFFQVKAKLDELEKPQKPELPSNVELVDNLETHKELLAIGSVIEQSFDRYMEASQDDLPSLDKIVKKKAALEKDLEKYNEKIPSLTSKLELAKQAAKSFKRLEERKLELKQSADDLEVLEMLVEAYSNKGIKLLLIKQIAALIEKNMNKYANLVYPESVKFHFQVVNDREFNILQERTQRGKKKTADVRTLSGAESRAFSFLLPLAVRPLIPFERRLNVMVLDEPTANMGTNRRELFIKSFVPKLNTLVPHCIIITTYDEHYPNSVEYTVTKEKGVSRLELTRQC